MTRDERIAFWLAEAAPGISGWDFSHISGRSHQDVPPWSYRDLALARIAGSRALLDVDTGGGEFLVSLTPLPAGTQAIESWPPNAPLAAARLGPLGVTVMEVSDGDAWPFADGAFDLILNRQGGLNTTEIARTLAPCGCFLTQQVAAGNLADLASLFPSAGEIPHAANTLDAAVETLTAHGLTVIRAEAWTGRQTFTDVGALVWFLTAVPWVVPGFSVAACVPVLEGLHARLEAGETLSFQIERFLVEAAKPRTS